MRVIELILYDSSEGCEQNKKMKWINAFSLQPDFLFQNSTGFVSQLTDTATSVSINGPVSNLNSRRDGGSFLRCVFLGEWSITNITELAYFILIVVVSVQQIIRFQQTPLLNQIHRR